MDPDLKTTLREFREYVTLSYELPSEIAARIGLTQPRIWDWLAGKSQPKAKSLMKLRRFLDAEAKKPLQGDGIRPVEPVTVQNHQTHSASPIRSALPVLPESARPDSQAGCRFVPGGMPQVWSDLGRSGRAIKKRSGRGMGGNKTRAEKSDFQEE